MIPERRGTLWPALLVALLHLTLSPWVIRNLGTNLCGMDANGFSNETLTTKEKHNRVIAKKKKTG